MKTFQRFSIFTVIVLSWNLFVILWRVYVRATGSGAGCRSHWPLCNGEVIPRSSQIEIFVEFTHRVTSGVAFVLVLIMMIWAYRIFLKGHPVRLGARISMMLIVSEVIVRAGLVLFQWVAHIVSTAICRFCLVIICSSRLSPGDIQ